MTNKHTAAEAGSTSPPQQRTKTADRWLDRAPYLTLPYLSHE